jgi:hypothetical protein
MQKREVAVCVAAAVLGLAVVVLGIAAERFKNKVSSG